MMISLESRNIIDLAQVIGICLIGIWRWSMINKMKIMLFYAHMCAPDLTFRTKDPTIFPLRCIKNNNLCKTAQSL